MQVGLHICHPGSSAEAGQFLRHDRHRMIGEVRHLVKQRAFRGGKVALRRSELPGDTDKD